jgi:hypothetical protein
MTSVPTDDALYADLRAARTRGLNNPDKPLDDLKALLEVAQVVSLERTESAKLEDALKKAIERLGGVAAASIMGLMGLTGETRGHGVKFRRIKAAALYDFKTYEVFRKRHEPALLMSVATHLSVLAEQQNVDRQDRQNHKEKSTLLQGDSFSGWPFYRTAETELEAIIGDGLIGASEKGLAPMLTTFAAGTSAYKNKTEIQKLEEILLWAITASEGHPLWTRVLDTAKMPVCDDRESSNYWGSVRPSFSHSRSAVSEPHRISAIAALNQGVAPNLYLPQAHTHHI